MIVVEDKKYACESCIKGHRSSACKHTDRPLFEVKKKGRPITQCAHCQELRKTRQVHVKCVCEVSEDAPPAPKGKKAKKPLNDAAFPGGIPSELEGVVVTNSVTEGSDSERASSPKACACKTGESCSCCLPRKRAAQPAPAEQGSTTSADGRLAPGSHPALPPATKVHYRPVLPRLTPSIGRRRNSEASSSGPLHDPSLGTAHPHAQRQHLVSPYGRAYEVEHGRALPPIQDAPLSHIVHEQPYAPPQTPEEPHFEPSWITPSMAPTPFVPSSCGCGAGCTCPGCAEHAAPGSNLSPAHAYDMCMDPQSCTACLQCSIMSLSVTAPTAFNAPFTGDLASEQVQSVQYPSIDEWVREISQAPPPALVSPYAPDASGFPEDAMAGAGTTSPLFEPQGGFAGWPASGTDVTGFSTYLPPIASYATSEPSAYPPSEPSGYPGSESADLTSTSGFTYAQSELRKAAYGMSADATQVGEVPFFQNLCRNCGCPPGQCGCDELRPGLTFATSGERVACNHRNHAAGADTYFEISPPVPNVFPQSYEGSSSSPASSRRSSHSHSRPVGTDFPPFTPLHVPGQQQNLNSRTFSDSALY